MLRVMLATVFLMVFGLQSTSSAQQDEGQAPQYRIELTGLSPLFITRNSRIQLAGTVTNLSTSSVDELNLTVSLGSLLRGRSEIPNVFARGQINNERPISDVLTRTSLAVLPGQTQSFTMSFDMSKLNLIDDGVYPLKIAAFDSSQKLAEATTAMPLASTSNPNFKTAVLWPMVTAPAQSSPDTAFGELLPQHLSATGSLSALLESLRPSFSLIVDPAISDFAKVARDGYFLTDGQAVRVGTETTQISSWYSRLQAGQVSNETWLVPYANPDLTLNQRSLIGKLVDNSYSFSRQEISSQRQRAKGVVSFIQSKFTDSKLLEIASLSEIVIIPSDLAPPVTTTNYTPDALTDWSALGFSAQAARLLVADSQISAAFNPLSPNKLLSDAAAALMVRQQLASELTMLSLERPSQLSSVVVVPPPFWAPTKTRAYAAAQALGENPLVNIVTLSEVADGPSSTITLRNSSPEQLAKSATLRPNQVDLIKQGAADLNRLRTTITASSLQLDELELGLNRALSRSWTKRTKMGRGLINEINRQIVAAEKSIAIVSSSELTLTGQLGALPVSISNGLDAPIRVSLVASPVLGTRIDLSTANAVLLEANQSLNLDVPIEISGSAPSQINLYLINGENERVGQGAVVQIRTTAYSQIAQWVSIISLLLLVIFAAISLSRKIKKKH